MVNETGKGGKKLGWKVLGRPALLYELSLLGGRSASVRPGAREEQKVSGTGTKG